MGCELQGLNLLIGSPSAVTQKLQRVARETEETTLLSTASPGMHSIEPFERRWGLERRSGHRSYSIVEAVLVNTFGTLRIYA